ncbi:MAG TPA: glycerol-3-phosphate responsive antiterminator [Candidatus Pygmaiobacter gallistercoris]|nr:glycerol-3-phosphate responsive antiterminator [Candidatus Pygmaiobacter gallistercoris]
MKMTEILKDSPIIAAVKDSAGLQEALKCDSEVFFILFGTICNIDEIVERAKSAGKIVFVHLDLVEGLAGKDVAVDFLKKNTRLDGIISTKPPLLKYAKSQGLLTVQRFFLLDSIAAANIDRQFATSRPDMVEVLPGLMADAIGEIAKKHPETPVIAGGLIRTEEEVLAALGAGAAAVSSTNRDVWFM